MRRCYGVAWLQGVGALLAEGRWRAGPGALADWLGAHAPEASRIGLRPPRGVNDVLPHLPKRGVRKCQSSARNRFMSASDHRVDPEVREVRRLDVIAGALGRCQWSVEERAREWSPRAWRPGWVISEVARRHYLRPQQLFA